MNRPFYLLLAGVAAAVVACGSRPVDRDVEPLRVTDKPAIVEPADEEPEPVDPEQIVLKKELTYDNHTLEDSYPYQEQTRSFQWEKIKTQLAWLETLQQTPAQWGILQNRQNKNGEAPLVKSWNRDRYKRVADTLGTERWQGIPLYGLSDTLTPVLYGMDGSLVRVLNRENRWREVETISGAGQGRYLVPARYLHTLADTVSFRKVAFVDRSMQNIALLEKGDPEFRGRRREWIIRSMNPATTGVDQPPHAQSTPLGIYVVQEKKSKMIYLKDGSTETGGFAPWASRFCNGAYIHGVPVNAPGKEPIEFSWSLGTTPRSHMCVRTATSQAKFFYDWAPTEQALVVVIE